jgi:hypothetical protein
MIVVRYFSVQFGTQRGKLLLESGHSGIEKFNLPFATGSTLSRFGTKRGTGGERGTFPFEMVHAEFL